MIVEDGDQRIEHLLSRLFALGTGLGSTLIAGGLMTGESVGAKLVMAGVATFVLLPVARVAVMLALFLQRRDGLFAIAAALVMFTILVAGLSDGGVAHPAAHAGNVKDVLEGGHR